MIPVTENDNDNFEILNNEISELPELEELNLNDRRFFDIFLEFWNVNVYPKFVMLAQQSSKEGSIRVLELVRRTKEVIALYNSKIKNIQRYSPASAPLEFQARFNELYNYFESIAEKRRKLTKNELDGFSLKINEFYEIINPPKKMSRKVSEAYETSTYETSRSVQSTIQPERFQVSQENNSPGSQYRIKEELKRPSPEKSYTEPNYFHETGTPPAKKSAVNFAIPAGIFCFFAGAGIAGPVGAAIGLALGLLIASRLESDDHHSAKNRPYNYNQPSDEILNDLKHAETISTAKKINSRTRVFNETPLTAEPRGDEHPGCAMSCMLIIICMLIGGFMSPGSGIAAGLFIGFFLSSLISDLIKGKNAEGGFTFNGFIIGMALGAFFDHPIIGIITGIFIARIIFSLFSKKYK